MNMQIGPPGNFCNRGIVPVPPSMSNVLSMPGRGPPLPMSVMRVPPPNVFRSSPPPGIRGLAPPFGTPGLSNMPPPPQGMMMPPLPSNMMPLMSNSEQRQQSSPPRLNGPHNMPNFNLPPPGWIPPHVAANVNTSQDNSRLMLPPFPIADFSELWVENKSPDNKPYYYNAKTRETTWNRPEGVKVITQEELEKMSQFHQQSLLIQQQVYKQEESKNKSSQAENTQTSNTSSQQQPAFMPFPRMPFAPQNADGKTNDQNNTFPPFMQQSALAGSGGGSGQSVIPPFGFPLTGQAGTFPFNVSSQGNVADQKEGNNESVDGSSSASVRKESNDSKGKECDGTTQQSPEHSDKPFSSEDCAETNSAARSPTSSDVANDAKESGTEAYSEAVSNDAQMFACAKEGDSQNLEDVQPIIEKCVNESTSFSPNGRTKDDEREVHINKSELEMTKNEHADFSDSSSSVPLQEHTDFSMTEPVNEEAGKLGQQALDVKQTNTESDRPLEFDVENEMRNNIPVNPTASAIPANANCLNPSLLAVPPGMFPGAVFPPNTWPPGACGLPQFNFPPLGIHPMQAVGDASHAFGIPRMPPIFPPFGQVRNQIPTADMMKMEATVEDKGASKFDEQKLLDNRGDDQCADVSKESHVESDLDLEKMREEYTELETKIINLKKEAAVWSEYKSPEGKQYFYNSDGMRSQWAKPKVLKDLEAAEADLKALQEKIMMEDAKKGSANSNEVKDASKMNECASVAQVNATHGTVTAKPEKKELSEEEIAKQRSKPVSSIPVLGTPWCIVWTGNGRVFYYNPTQKLSVWEKPAELIGRADVDKMVTEPPPEVEAILGRFAKRKSDLDEDTSAAKKARSKSNGDGTESKPNNVVEEENDKEGMDVDDSGIARIEIGKEAAIEAEAKAAKERTQIPYDVRVQQFRQMLKEKEVSAFSTWEKELHKIVFDRRYLLLVSKERKAVFEKYVKERAEEERKEKAVKLRKRKDDFRELLKEANIKSSSLFTDFAAKYAKDERFRSMEKMRDRELLFNEYISELRKRDREEKNSDHERLKKVYFTLMKEARLDRSNLTWSEAKRLLENDPRYRSIDSSSKKEEWFREFMKQQEDKRYRSDAHDDDDERTRRRDRERQERIDASIRKRQEEVKEQLSGSLREREKERDQLRKVEATENFRVLLMDMVRNADADWKETKKVLKKDGRWELCKLLDKDEKEKIFHEHVCGLNKKKKEAFHQLLAETPEVTLTARWKTVKKAIKHDARFEKFSSNDKKREKEFEEFIREKYLRAKEDFRELLKETKIITYKSYSAVRDSEQNLKDIESVLAKDKRYLILDCVPGERKKILCDYLEELELRGPPPPPTASEPSRRK